MEKVVVMVAVTSQEQKNKQEKTARSEKIGGFRETRVVQ